MLKVWKEVRSFQPPLPASATTAQAHTSQGATAFFPFLPHQPAILNHQSTKIHGSPGTGHYHRPPFIAEAPITPSSLIIAAAGHQLVVVQTTRQQQSSLLAEKIKIDNCLRKDWSNEIIWRTQSCFCV
ncbi:hypothetical protein AAHE18_02G141200 [Arachis hypogaea]